MVKPKIIERYERLLKIGINILILLAIACFLGFYLLNKQLEAVKKASEERIKSILIANELRQTSDNLTRLARNYIITKDPTQKQYYLEILKIRNGQLARPSIVTSIYSDELAPSGIKTVSDKGKPFSLIQIAINEGINSEEIKILRYANRLSDLLALKEEKAFDFIDKNKETYNKEAIDLVFGKGYRTEKNEIIYTINDFYNTLNNRTRKEFLIQESTLNKIVLAMSVVLAFSLITFVVVIYSYRKVNKSATDAYLKIEKYSTTLAEMNESKNKFFSIIAHDIKSPFVGFLGLTKMLAEDSEHLSKDEIQAFAKSMQKSANNLFELLENLLDWANSESSINKFQPEKVNVSDIIIKNIELFHETASNKQIVLKNHITKDTTVLADVRMLDVILRNLISNAIKFSRHGGEIIVGTIDTKKLSGKYTIYIKDNGLGISESEVHDIFKINKKISNLGTDGEKGTGLGLILCKQFIEKNNGEIWVESILNEGTTFYFTLPIA